MKEFLKTNYKSIIIVVFAILIFSSIQTCNDKSKKVIEQTDLVSSLNDSIKLWKDKDSLNHSEKQIIETEKTKDFLNIKSKDKEIVALQDLVRKYKNQLGDKGSVALIKGETVFDTVYSKPIIKYKEKNLLWKDSVHNKWVTWDYQVKQDSLKTKTIIRNKFKMQYEYAIIYKEKDNGWFKKNTPYAEVVNFNPYSKNVSQTVYRILDETKPKRFGIGPNISYSITNSFKTEVSVGIGLQYNIIKF